MLYLWQSALMPTLAAFVSRFPLVNIVLALDSLLPFCILVMPVEQLRTYVGFSDTY